MHYYADGGAQGRLTPDGLAAAIGAESPHVDWPRALAELAALAGELFGGAAAPLVGAWPRSRAYYGIDVVFDDARAQRRRRRPAAAAPALDGGAEEEEEEEEDLQPVPKLLEVNFMGDFESIGTCARDGGEPERFDEWLGDVLTVIATDEPAAELDANNPRLTRLSATPR